MREAVVVEVLVAALVKEDIFKNVSQMLVCV